LLDDKPGAATSIDMTGDGEAPGRSPRFYTIGYQGQTPEAFLKALRSNRVERLVDVREVARSRKSGFSSRALSEFLSTNGIEYIHMQRLGSPREARRKLREDNDFVSFSTSFESTLKQRGSDIASLIDLALEKPTAIMCFERNPAECHRSIIAAKVQELGFDVMNL